MAFQPSPPHQTAFAFSFLVIQQSNGELYESLQTLQALRLELAVYNP